MKKTVLIKIVFILLVICFFSLPLNIFAKVRISNKQLTMTVSEKYTLKLIGTKSKTLWKSSKPKIAKVNNKGKITALKKGKTVISAKAGKKVYKCNVTVRKAKKMLWLQILSLNQSY